jgi:hypothetical protein
MKRIFWTALLVGLAVCPSWAKGEKSFKTPKLAVHALLDALKSKNGSQLSAIFGPELKGVLEPQERDEAIRVLSKAFAEHWSLVPSEEGGRILRLGAEGWPFPVPLARGGQGWHFDTTSGMEEILNRRVGRNELLTIATLHRLMVAQKEYQAKQGSFATRLLSNPGQHDGLYWKAPSAQDQSPLEKALGHAFQFAEGHVQGSPWFGYHYQIRPGQGFELIAYPVNYARSGVMSFVCNQEGQIYQKDLGVDTLNTVKAMESFAPDSSWIPVNEKL